MATNNDNVQRPSFPVTTQQLSELIMLFARVQGWERFAPLTDRIEYIINNARIAGIERLDVK